MFFFHSFFWHNISSDIVWLLRILVQNFLTKQYFLFQAKDQFFCFPTKSLLILIFVVHLPFANQQSTLMRLLLNGLGDCYWKHTLIKKILFPSPGMFSLFFGFFVISMNVIFEKGLWDTVFLGRLPKTIPKKQRGLSLEKVTKRWLQSLTVCSPWSPAKGCLRAEGMSALQRFLSPDARVPQMVSVQLAPGGSLPWKG